ncbi:MAG: Asp-tRNA(Asn)/Glu-tRNA(Gln) amidotransferase subunit GatB [Candidatus Aureabacteria bacterium]|nr:Asp-tRNA(Asn)/Glu-tRNA(Gln) amidotransferase subunit GatB [Candidatus Auribacterota bacterium]
MPDYEAVIGLEVHVQLKTRSKIFCGCPTTFGAEPNTSVCPVCLGLPGSLPVLNETALRYSILTGIMLGSTISSFSKFDRKNYFYPDLPKNYQISQYDLPLCVGGELEIEFEGKRKRIGITRVHLEEDAGKLVHAEVEGEDSGVDFNRTGVPLLEIVSEPEISSPEEAFAYLKGLKLTLQYLGVSDCDMEKGSLRCDANVSVRPRGEKLLGVKVEVKNMNSFRAVQKALAYEIERQNRAIAEGQRIVQETRLWEAESEMTHPMRSKEEAHDYRYFPEPDLVPVMVDHALQEVLRASLPEAPLKRRDRLVAQYALPEYDVEVLTSERELADYFEACVTAGAEPKAASNLIMGEMLRLLKERALTLEGCKITPKHIVEILALVSSGAITGTTGKEVFAEMFETGKRPGEIVHSGGLAQISDQAELDRLADEVIAKNTKSVEDYRSGKAKAIGFLVGQVMKATKGKANPQMVNEILKKKLEKDSSKR